MPKSIRGRIAIVAFSFLAVACATIIGLEPPPEGGIDSDSSTPDTSTPLSDAACVPLDAANDAGVQYRAFVEALVDDSGVNAITYFNIAQLPGSPTSFSGGAFDGTNIYLVPENGSTIVQYNTTKPFSSNSFAEFEIATSLGIDETSFAGATFDGRYLYLAPVHDFVTADAGSRTVRYDTTAPFTAVASWSSFDTQTLPTPDGGVSPRGFEGATYDGRYVYLVPYFNAITHDGRFARYDTLADAGAVVTDAGDASVSPFAIPSHWSTFDLGAQNAAAVGFIGGVFDGRYMYFAPYISGLANSTGGYSGYAARYDTTTSFTNGADWSTFQISQVDPAGAGFFGAAFDGRYIYFAPHYSTKVARYDTTVPFTTYASWSFFDLAPIVAFDASAFTFDGIGFDGRFMYFTPATSNLGIVPRYDTLSPFNSLCAWTTTDVSKSNATATSFVGSVYDGRYLYMIPRLSTLVRFDTKNISLMPNLPEFHGSFF